MVDPLIRPRLSCRCRALGTVSLLLALSACGSSSGTKAAAGAGGMAASGGSTGTGGAGGASQGGAGGAASSTGGSATNGGASNGGVAGVGGGECNSLPNDGPIVETLDVAANSPTLNGGAIPLGIYRVTALARYTGPTGTAGPTGETFQETVEFDGSHAQVVFTIGTVNGGQGPEVRGTQSYVVGGGVLAEVPVCGNVSAATENYEVNAPASGPTTLKVQIDTSVATLTKQ